MHISSSPSQHDAATHESDNEFTRTTIIPVQLGERSLILLALLRIFVGLLWFQQLFWKLPPGFTGLHRYVVEEGQYSFLPGYAFVIQHIFLPNFILLGACVWIAELLVSLSLLFGLFTRLGAMLATLLSIQLYIGLAYAPGEWYWTYGMLVLLVLVLATVPTGRRLGIDQWLAPRLAGTAATNNKSSFLRWFV